MNFQYCANCGHRPVHHQADGCDETLHTLYGAQPCGCATYEKDPDD
jgi:hypothetical protein